MQTNEKLDMLIINGNIYTQDDERSKAEAIGIKDNKIAFIGSSEEAKVIDAEEVLDVEGRNVIPGFIEPHAHVTLAGVSNMFKINLSECGHSKENYFAEIRKFVEEHPEMEAYEGFGWLNSVFGPNGPTRQELDVICSDKPMVIASADVHSAWVNSKAIELCGVTRDTPVPYGNTIEYDENGDPSGCVRELQVIEYFDKVKVKFTKEQYKIAVKKVQETFASYGITTVLDPLINPYDESTDALLEMERDGELLFKFRGAFQSFENDPLGSMDRNIEIRSKTNGDMLRFDQVKILSDGVVEGRTAYLKKPYADEEGFCSEPIWQRDDLLMYCKEADKLGFDLHFHTMGDAATEMVVDVLEKVVAENPPRDRKMMGTHFQVVDPIDIDRMSKLGMMAITNPYWHFKTPFYYEEIELPYLGDRATKEYPMKSFVDAGVVVGAASDFNVTPVPYPLVGMMVGEARVMSDSIFGKGGDPTNIDDVLCPEERVSRQIMLDAFTRNNALATGDEEITGSLEVGKRADIVILDKDLFDVPVMELENIKVCTTISEGKIIYSL